jgi:hypothetical protein
VLCAAAFAAAVFPLKAAVIEDPTLVSAASGTPIDPEGSRQVSNQFGNATKADLNVTKSGIFALQSWAGFEAFGASAATNIVSFTDATLPDIRFTLSGSPHSTAGSQITDTAQMTSGKSGYKLVATAASADLTLTIDFGNYDKGTFTPGVGVKTAAFTISNVRNLGTGYSVEFRNSLGTVLASFGPSNGNNTADGNPADKGTGLNFLYAHESDGTVANAISQIVITRAASVGGTSTQGLDDFGFTEVIP